MSIKPLYYSNHEQTGEIVFMRKLFTHIIGIVIVSVLTTQIVSADEFRIEFVWDPDMKRCFSRESPEIKLFNVPEGTTQLRVKMVDKNAPSYPHGGGKVDYNGEASIVKGALKKWKGPCPPSGTHTYEFTVRARAGKKKVGKASYAQPFQQ